MTNYKYFRMTHETAKGYDESADTLKWRAWAAWVERNDHAWPGAWLELVTGEAWVGKLLYRLEHVDNDFQSLLDARVFRPATKHEITKALLAPLRGNSL